jgi:lysozyme family protein
MSRFRICLDRVLKHEGGFVNHPKDPGGATNFGITQATLADFRKKPVTVAEVKSMTKDEAGEIYRWRYWSPPLCEALPEGVDYMVFDLAVNSGVSRAVKFLQLTVGATPDGKVGPATLKAVSSMPAREILEKMSDRREAFFRSLPTFPTFGRGWLRRLDDVTRDSLKDAA